MWPEKNEQMKWNITKIREQYNKLLGERLFYLFVKVTFTLQLELLIFIRVVQKVTITAKH